MKASTSLILLLSFLLHVSLAAYCPAGYYHTTNIERPCYQCNIGSYCPGDDKSYPCADGTAAPRTRQYQCDVCESKRSNAAHTYCVLPDAPQDARESTDYNFALDTDRPFWFTSIYFGDFGSYTGDIAQFTFVDKMPQVSRSVVVYASRKTGKPGPDNYEFKGEGQNVTLAIPRQDGESNTVMYFNVVPVEQKQVQFAAKAYYWLSKTYQITEETTTIDAGVDLARWPDTGARFIIDKVPANSVVNFNVSLEGMRFHDTDVHFRLFYTSLKNIEYPNVNNAQVAVTSSKATVAHAALVTKVTEGGPFYVSLATTTLWDARIIVKVTVTRETMEFNLH